MPTVAELIVSRLAEAGVQCLFGMPGGGSNLDLVEAAGQVGLPFVLTHTETAGAIAASAQADLTGRPGACLATIGPGVASLVNGAAHALLDRVPLVLLTDSMPASARKYTHQRLDHGALLSTVTKGSFSIEAERAEEMIRDALALATAPAPGPVHVDLAPDVSRQPVPMNMPAFGSAVEPDQSAPIGLGAGEILKDARRPLVIAGLGVRDPRDADAVRQLAEHHGIPVLVTYKAKGVMPDDHPLFGGVFTNGAIEKPLVEMADLIIGVGLDPVEFLPRPWDYRAPVVLCNRWPLEQEHLPVSASLIGELPETLSAMDKSLPSSSEWQPAEIEAHAKRQRNALHVASDGWAPWRAVEAAAGAFEPDTRVTVDAGAHMFPVTALWPVRQPRQMLISNGLSTMAYALPAAIGAAFTDRSRRVVALTGDGGLLMCLAELRTAAQEHLKVTVIVFHDRSLSLIRIKQERLGFKPAGMSLEGVDWRAAAKAFGVPAWRARNDKEMKAAIKKSTATDGPALIEAVVDPSSYPETLRAIRG